MWTVKVKAYDEFAKESFNTMLTVLVPISVGIVGENLRAVSVESVNEISAGRGKLRLRNAYVEIV